LLPGNLGRAAEMLYDSSNRLTKIGTKNITHDVDGRITADATQDDPITYAYDAQDLITSVIKNAVTTDQYTYDGDGKRLSRNEGGVITRYVQDPTGGDLYSLLAESNSANQVQYYYIYGEGLVSQVNGTSHKYYHYDQSGNTLALTDDNGIVTDKYAYEPFGSTTVKGTSHNPFRFVGAYGVMDDGNGLHYMRARYYNTEARRFMSLDARYGQVTDPMALNRYQYVSGNPMVGVDPSGKYTEEEWSSIGDTLFKAGIKISSSSGNALLKYGGNGLGKISDFKDSVKLVIKFADMQVKVNKARFEQLNGRLKMVASEPNDDIKTIVEGSIGTNYGAASYEYQYILEQYSYRYLEQKVDSQTLSDLSRCNFQKTVADQNIVGWLFRGFSIKYDYSRNSNCN